MGSAIIVMAPGSTLTQMLAVGLSPEQQIGSLEALGQGEDSDMEMLRQYGRKSKRDKI